MLLCAYTHVDKRNQRHAVVPGYYLPCMIIPMNLWVWVKVLGQGCGAIISEGMGAAAVNQTIVPLQFLVFHFLFLCWMFDR